MISRLLVILTGITTMAVANAWAAPPVVLNTPSPADPADYPRAERTYIYSAGASEADMVALQHELIEAGARSVDLFLPDNVIVAELPLTKDVSGVFAGAAVARISEQQVLSLSSEEARRMDWIAATYALAEQMASAPPLAASVDPDFCRVGDGPTPERVKEIQRELYRLQPDLAPSAEHPERIERNIQQNSELLTGLILASFIYPESSGRFEQQTEDWTDDDLATAVQAATTMMLNYKSQFPNMNINLIFKHFRRADTGYEPILHNMDTDPLWIADTMHNLGYGIGSGDAEAVVHEFNSALRLATGAEWAFTGFIVCARKQPNHRFLGANYTAYAVALGGPYNVSPFPAGTDPNQIGDLLLSSQIYQHETGHTFWAMDEYSGSPASSDGNCNNTSGYLNYRNGNLIQSGGPAGDTPCTNPPLECMMNVAAREDSGRPFCFYSLGQIGVADANENNIPDVFEAWPEIEWESAEPETVSTNEVTLHFKGIAKGVPNRNPVQAPSARVDYVLPLTNAFYRLNGSVNLDLVPDDGRFGEAMEDFTIHVVDIQPGLTRFQVWIENSIKLRSTGAHKDVFFLGVNWQHFTADLRDDEVELAWETAGEDFGATYNVRRSRSGHDWEVIAVDVPVASGGTNGYVPYRVVDTDVLPGNSYRYQIEAISDLWAEGEPRRSNPITVTAVVPISEGIISSAVPNPFNGETAISVFVPETFQEGQGTSGSGTPVTFVTRVPTAVNISVYDVAGRLVRRVADSYKLVDRVTVRWDGRDQYGQRVPSGVYFIKAKAGEDVGVRKVLLLK